MVGAGWEEGGIGACGGGRTRSGIVQGSLGYSSEDPLRLQSSKALSTRLEHIDTNEARGAPAPAFATRAPCPPPFPPTMPSTPLTPTQCSSLIAGALLGPPSPLLIASLLTSPNSARRIVLSLLPLPRRGLLTGGGWEVCAWSERGEC